jgi:hypothetical protein
MTRPGLATATALAVALLTAVPAAAAERWFVKGVPWYPQSSVWELDISKAPLSSKSAEYVSWWGSHSSNKSVNLVGARDGTVASYSFATTYGEASDPIYTVTASSPSAQTFQIHVDPSAKLSSGDGELVIYDVAKTEMLKIGGSTATINHATRKISASSWNWRNTDGTFFGLDRDAGSKDTLARGHRGLDSSVLGWRYEEVRAKLVPHMVKMAVPSAVNSGTAFAWPYVATESRKTGRVPEGSRVRVKAAACTRIRPTLANDYARAMLDSLCTYGSLIGDSGGEGINMKLENPALWTSLGITRTSLAAVKITDFEFIDPNYGRP